MADEDLLLNFDLGIGPIKPQVIFKGGRWRDRKRAQKSARLQSSQPLATGDGGDDEPKDSKRRRLEDDQPSFSSNAKPRISYQSKRRHDSDHDDTIQPGLPDRPKNRPADPKNGPRHVVSRLFSYNPVQTTTATDEAKCTTPQPTNAPLLDISNFGTLALSSRLVDELAKMNLHHPTAIQQKVIPHLLSSSSDAFVQAETGSGKTFSYLLPIIHRVLHLSSARDETQIHRDSGIFAIIVSPTRELAKQVYTVLEQLIRPFPWLVSTAITGGESKKAEKARLRKGVNFLIATPGRLADHIDNTQALSLTTVRWLILDEGDRLMDLGFENDLKKAISALRGATVAKTTTNGATLESLPDRRVTVLCSATMKMNVHKLGDMSLADAALLAADNNDKSDELDQTVYKAPAQLHQFYVVVPSKLRLVTLISHIRSVFSHRGRTKKVIIFMSCADSVDFHYELLRQPNVQNDSSKDVELTAKTVCKSAYLTSAASPEIVLHRMHGSLSQPTRTATLRSFSACAFPSVLITTDVSSRGLDIPAVDLVVEYDPAFSFADHIHRIGRTARAGRPGDAVLYLLPGAEEGYIELLKASTVPSTLSFETNLKTGLTAKLEYPVKTVAKSVDGSSYHEKAENLQLHIEQRLINDSARLEFARNGFRSHIRAYATHIKDERVHFDMTQLHLGHVAKSFGLREAPGGLGAGIERKARKGPPERAKDQGRGQKSSQDMINKKSMLLMSAAADEFNIG